VTIGLWLCSGAVVGLLAFFSMRNRQTGWKKSRTTLAAALSEFYADLGLPDAPEDIVALIVTAPIVGTGALRAPNADDFSLQLINLNGALGDSSPLMSSPRVSGLVAVQSR
jgi:hypothetical protein